MSVETSYNFSLGYSYTDGLDILKLRHTIIILMILLPQIEMEILQ